MSSHGFEPPLRIEPRLSRRTLALLALVHGLVATAPFGLLPASAAVPIAFLALAALAWEWRRASGVRPLEWSGSGEWWIGGDGPWRLRPATVLTPRLVVLVLEQGRRRRRIPLFPDSLPAAEWRRLRARLRRCAVGADLRDPRVGP